VPDEQIVRGNDARIMRGTEDGDDFGVMADDEDCRVMRDVVRFRAVMRVAFDDDSKRRRQGFDRVVRAGDAFEGGIEVVEVTAYSLRRIAPGIDADEKNIGWLDASLSQVAAGGRKRLHRNRTDVGAVSEAEEHQCHAIFQIGRREWLTLCINETDVGERQQSRENRRGLGIREILTKVRHPNGRARQHHERDNENSEHGSDHAPDYLIRSIIRGP